MTTERILSTIAHFEMAVRLDADVAGMSGFTEAYLSKLDPNEVALIRRYKKIKTTAWKDVAHMLERSPG